VAAITIVGGGLAGLVAGIACAEGGAEVRLFEAHSELGGRARTSRGPFVTNLGPHALYSDGPWWPWLAARGLLLPVAKPALWGARFRIAKSARRRPPLTALVKSARLRREQPPIESDFRSWATERCGPRTAAVLAAGAGVFSYDHDPGRLSAAFVWERLIRVNRFPSAARYVKGGWSRLVRRLEQHARVLGVVIETGARIDALPDPPVIVATELDEARRITGDESLRWEGTRAVLLDIGLLGRRGDPHLLVDLEQAGFAERFSARDHSLAPPGHDLIQAVIGKRPAEDPSRAAARLEGILDVGFEHWRERQVWSRRQAMDGNHGALDLPGTSWRDRPAIDRGDGVFVAGDMVAAPGMLSEVALNSAIGASHGVLTWANRPGLAINREERR
jgi:phytoene dehydrogenase-like protein